MQCATQAATVSGELVPVSLWNERHLWPPAGGLRHLIFNAKSNGFDRCIRRVGRRVLIDETAFFEWVADQQREEASQ
jgi:hypothetical protein